MQLNRFTEFGVRVMMYLTQCRDRAQPVTIPEIAERFGISRNHLVKVVHFLSQQGLVAATRGKGGGLALARPADGYRVGELVRLLEHQGNLVECADPPCALHGACRLAGVLHDALRTFYAELDRYTLAELVRQPTGAAIIRLHGLAA